jgi:hypothetical protein
VADEQRHGQREHSRRQTPAESCGST